MIAPTQPRNGADVPRYFIRLIPENRLLAAFSLRTLTKGGVRLDVGDVSNESMALRFDLPSADYMAALIQHLGHACSVEPCK